MAKTSRFVVHTVINSGVGRGDREPHKVLDSTTNRIIDEYSSKRAAQMHAKFLNSEPNQEAK